MKAAFALIVLGLIGCGRASAQSKPTDAPPADETAIRALVAEFSRAFNAGDAKAVASLFTENARIATERGKAIEGRSAVEALFASSFEAAPGQTIVLKTENLRLLGPDAAVEDGSATITDPSEEGDGRARTLRYSAAYVKKDGRWLQDSIRDYPTPETPDEKTAHDHLKELEWLVGEWMDEDDDAEVQTSCAWSESRSFLIRSFKLRVQGRVEMSGVQRIGWDPRLNQFRSWVFDSEGGFSDGLWSRDGDRWIIKTTGVLKDGRAVTATNVLTRINADSFRWGSIDLTVGSVALPEAEDTILVRKPPSPHAAATSSSPTRTPQ